MPLSEAKVKPSRLIDEVELTHEMNAITRHGRPAAVLIAADDLESLQETLLWVPKPGIADAVASAERDYAAGQTVRSDDLRAQFGLSAK